MEYIEIRRKLKDVYLKIFRQEINDTGYLLKGAKLLGLDTEGNRVIFDNENDQEAYWDFLTYENFNSKNSLFTNAIINKTIDSDEIDFIKKITVFDTALYWMGPVNENKILITNISTSDSYKLSDVNLSKFDLEGYLVFFRLLSIEGYFITSGFSFIFSENIPVVIKREKILMKKEYTVNKSISRFRVMLKLNRMYGMTVEHQDV